MSLNRATFNPEVTFNGVSVYHQLAVADQPKRAFFKSAGLVDVAITEKETKEDALSSDPSFLPSFNFKVFSRTDCMLNLVTCDHVYYFFRMPVVSGDHLIRTNSPCEQKMDESSALMQDVENEAGSHLQPLKNQVAFWDLSTTLEPISIDYSLFPHLFCSNKPISKSAQKRSSQYFFRPIQGNTLILHDKSVSLDEILEDNNWVILA